MEYSIKNTPNKVSYSDAKKHQHIHSTSQDNNELFNSVAIRLNSSRLREPNWISDISKQFSLIQILFLVFQSLRSLKFNLKCCEQFTSNINIDSSGTSSVNFESIYKYISKTGTSRVRSFSSVHFVAPTWNSFVRDLHHISQSWRDRHCYSQHDTLNLFKLFYSGKCIIEVMRRRYWNDIRNKTYVAGVSSMLHCSWLYDQIIRIFKKISIQLQLHQKLFALDFIDSHLNLKSIDTVRKRKAN